MHSQNMPFFMEYLMAELRRLKQNDPSCSAQRLAEMLEIESRAIITTFCGEDAFTFGDCRKMVRKLGLRGSVKRKFVSSIAEHKKESVSASLSEI